MFISDIHLSFGWFHCLIVLHCLFFSAEQQLLSCWTHSLSSLIKQTLLVFIFTLSAQKIPSLKWHITQCYDVCFWENNIPECTILHCVVVYGLVYWNTERSNWKAECLSSSHVSTSWNNDCSHSQRKNPAVYSNLVVAESIDSFMPLHQS